MTARLEDYLLWPGALPWLLLPLLLLALRTLHDWRRRRQTAVALGPRSARLASERSDGARLLRRGCGGLGLLLAGAALLQPLGETHAGSARQRGVDLVVCLDVSRSMLARDLQPDRLGAARREIEALCARLKGDRVALVLFAGTARLTVPLTQDAATLAELAQQASPLSVARGGTDLGAALDAALAALGNESGRHGAVLLLTDGEDRDQLGLQAAGRCRQQGVVVHCIGFGSVIGSRIALGGGDGFLRDRDGREVVSALDATSLRAIAERTGGDYVDASVQPRPLVMLYERRVLPMLRQAFASEERLERDNLYQWPLLAAALLWMLELSWCERKR